MPREKQDRPQVVPKGSINLAFLGQFVEIEGDCVFTVEYSVRSAMIGVYKLLGLDKNPPEIYPSQYDIRVLAKASQTMKSDDEGMLQKVAEHIIKRKLKNTTLEDLI